MHAGAGVKIADKPRIVQIDSRGQIVIPKEMRDSLGIKGKADFSLFSVSDEGIFLKAAKKGGR